VVERWHSDGAVPVAAPARVRALLAAAPDGPVEVVHRGPLALYVAVGGRCVGLLAAGAVRVPCALVSTVPELPTSAGRSARVDRGILHVDGRPLVVGRVVDVHAPRLDRGALARATIGPLPPEASPPAAVTALVASAAPEGIDPTVVGRLVGRGDGLTPLGDDVVAGWLATHRAAGVATPDVDRAVLAHAHRTTLLSATLLECAVHGEVLPELGGFLAALGTPAAASRARALLAVGGSSGAGILAGSLLALDRLHTEAIAA
jgi:hypothetical protein